MRGQQHRLAGCSQRLDRRPQLAGADRVDADRRFVEEHHLGIVQEAARDVQALAHAARVALDPLALTSAQPDQLQQLRDASLPRARRHAVELGEIAQVVERRDPLVGTAVAAEHIADAAPHLTRLLDHVHAEHAGAAGGRDQKRDQHLDGRGLTGAVRPEQPEQFTLADLEATPRTASTSSAWRRTRSVRVR